MLFAGGPAEVDSRRLDTFVPHKVGEEGNVVESFEEVLCEPVAKRVRIDHFLVDAILVCEMFKLHSYAACSYSVPESVEEEIAGSLVFLVDPIDRFVSEVLRYI